MVSSTRSRLMRSIKRENTAPEIAVRRFLYGHGFRYRLHGSGLPGTPDLVMPRFGTVIFVHGCFWHGHTCRHGSIASKTNPDFWSLKIKANRSRDERKEAELRALGWKVEVVWECETQAPAVLKRLLRRLESRRR